MHITLHKTFRSAIVVSAIAAALVPAAQAQDKEFIPGYTDFPNALRVESSEPKFTPGHSDFPNHLRVGSIYDRARSNGGAEEPAVVVSPAPGGFNWADAGIGAGGAGLVLLAIGGALLALTRRPTRRAALTG